MEPVTKYGRFGGAAPWLATATVMTATALFLHPFLIPTTLKEDTEKRAKHVVEFILAGFLIEPVPVNKRRATARRRSQPQLH